jgi:catechol 2,3-dioxygenase-like lactoylglutathione lyase family enzyme
MRLQHVSTPYPEGADEQVRGFYGRLLGLEEKPVPDSLQGRGLVWFAAGDDELELHFLPDSLPPDSRAQRHFCLEVGDLDACRRRLVQAGFAPSEETAIPNRPRFFCRDPFGNLLELTTIVGDYREGRAG